MKTFYKLLAIFMIFGLVFAALPSASARAAGDPEVAKPIQAAADWLISEQMESGGWGSSGMTALGTVGEIGKGLAEAYDRLDDADYLAALQAAGAYLMTKTDNFSPADGILAYELDSILGGKTYTEFVNTNYFDKLATDTYDAQIYDYSIPGYVLQENLGYSSYLPTLTDWLNSNDPALGLISAYLVGAETTPWSKAVKEKIETLDLMEDWSYLIVAKSIFSLSFVGEIFDPQIGPYASAANLSKIGEALAAYQLPSGAIPPELWTGNEEYVQTTAYAILAFNQIDSFTFKAKIEAAANYLLSVQNTAGYWEFWWSGNYVNTALSIWALNEAYPPAVACTTDCYVSPAGSDANLGNADSPFKTIQKGIESVADGGTVHVANGTYVESPNIYKSLSLIGESEAGVTIDARTFADYGMDVNGDFATTFQNFTLLGHPTSASAYGLKVSGDAASTTIDHVTVTGSWRSGIDLNGLNGGTVSNVTVRNSGYGVGLALTDCSNVAVSNVTTSGNAWGGMAIYTGNTTSYGHGSNGVSLTGTNSFGETNKLYIQTVPGVPVTNFTQTMFPYTVKNGEYLWFVSNLAEAGGLALGLPAPFVTANSSIELLSDGSQWVVNGMTIQAAIDAAAPGDTVHVLAGTYTEQVTINKNLHLIGSGSPIIKAPASLPFASTQDSYILKVAGAGVSAEIEQLTVSGPGPTGCGSMGQGILVRDGAYAYIHDNSILDVRDATFSGCQNGIAIQVGRNAWTTTGTARIENNIITGYQKGAIVVDNAGSSAQIIGNTITGAGTTAVIAQNGIQISRGATATLTGNTVSGNSFFSTGHPDNYASAGLLFYNAGPITLAGGNTLSGNDQNLYVIGTSPVTIGAETFGAPACELTHCYHVIAGGAGLDLTQSTFEGVNFATATPEQILPFAGRIRDGIDDGTSGVANLKNGYEFVDAEGKIQYAVNHAATLDTIMIGAGTYAEDVVLTAALNPNKQLSFVGEKNVTGDPVPVLLGSLTIDLPFADDGWRIENLNFKTGTVNKYLLSMKNVTETTATQGALVKNCTFELFDEPGVYTTDQLAITVPSGIPNGNNHLTIDGCEFRNGFNSVIQGYFNDLKVKNSLIENVRSGINFQGGLGGLTVTNTTIAVTGASAADSTYGIRMSVPGLSVTGSRLTVNDLFPAIPGVYHTNIVLRGTGTGVVEGNTILGSVKNENAATVLDASPNYWGSPCGPAGVYDKVTFAPWYIDSSMTTTTDDVATGNYTFPTPISTAEMNAVIACAAPYTTLNFDGTYPGGLIVPPDRHHLTFLLKDGAVIDSNTFGFNVFGDHIRIQGELGSYGKGVIKPGNGGTGILVNYMPQLYGAPSDSPLEDLVIDGIEIDGSGRTTGQGIYAFYFIKDLQILNNYIHDMDAEVILFEDEILDTLEIQGNMFKNNAFGVVDLGSHVVNPNFLDFEFNSWGNFVVTDAMAFSGQTMIDYTPWTHAELFIEHVAGSSPWTDKVFSDDSATITYAVKASLKESMGAQFDLLIPAGLTVVDTDLNGVFAYEFLTPDTGKLTYAGSQFTSTPPALLPITNELVTLFTVTFKTDAAGTYPLTIDEDSAVFGMLPWEMVGSVRVTGGSSTWVYLDEAHPASITAFEKPAITSADIQGPYITGIPQEFHVLTTNPTGGGTYSNVLFNYRITGATMADVASFEYFNGTNWLAMPLSPEGSDLVGYFGPVAGFPMGPDYSANTLFRVTFNNAKSYPFVLTLNDLSANPDAELARFEATAVVYQQPAITSTDIQGYYLTGEKREFTVNVNNPLPALGNAYYPVMFKFTIKNVTLADVINSAEYFETFAPANTWQVLPLQQVGADVVGWYGLINYGGFNLPADGLDHPGLLRVDFKQAGVYPVLVELYQLDGGIDPTYAYDDDIVRKVAEKAFSMTAYEKPVITPTNLGGPFDAGVAETVSLSIANPTPIPQPFELVFTYPAGTVISYGGVDYTCAATCPAIPVTLPVGTTVLDFTVTLDEAWTGDVNVSLLDSDWTPAPHRLLATASATGVVVNGDFALTGTFWMQGRTSRAGIPVTFTWGGTLAPYARTVPTFEQISNNLVVSLLYGGEYTITTNQPRYLNLIADNGKKITAPLAAGKTLNSLELKGGNAVWSDNVINIQDAGVVGLNFNQTGDIDSDVNFDLKVNIQDLSLVGGNFDLTSTAAYGSWVPVTLP